MSNGKYKTRKHQLEAEIREVLRTLSMDHDVDRFEKQAIREAMRSAFNLGQITERYWAIDQCRAITAIQAEDRICSKSLDEVAERKL